MRFPRFSAVTAAIVVALMARSAFAQIDVAELPSPPIAIAPAEALPASAMSATPGNATAVPGSISCQAEPGSRQHCAADTSSAVVLKKSRAWRRAFSGSRGATTSPTEAHRSTMTSGVDGRTTPVMVVQRLPISFRWTFAYKLAAK
jgi:hypothetical protein